MQEKYYFISYMTRTRQEGAMWQFKQTLTKKFPIEWIVDYHEKERAIATPELREDVHIMFYSEIDKELFDKEKSNEIFY